MPQPTFYCSTCNEHYNIAVQAEHTIKKIEVPVHGIVKTLHDPHGTNITHELATSRAVFEAEHLANAKGDPRLHLSVIDETAMKTLVSRLLIPFVVSESQADHAAHEVVQGLLK